MSLLEMFSFPFIQRALAAGVLVSLCAALLGVPLVLKRYSMIGDGLSHVSFGALSVALAAGWSPLKVSIPVVTLAAFFLLRITENSRVKSDAAIAMISASALAAGQAGRRELGEARLGATHQGGLEEHLRAAEALLADGDDLPIWELVVHMQLV